MHLSWEAQTSAASQDLCDGEDSILFGIGLRVKVFHISFTSRVHLDSLPPVACMHLFTSENIKLPSEGIKLSCLRRLKSA